MDRMPAEMLITCDVKKKSSDGRFTFYEVCLNGATVLRHRFCEFRALYANMHLLLGSFRQPPRKHILSCLDGDLRSRRREWIVALTKELVSKHSRNKMVKDFYELSSSFGGLTTTGQRSLSIYDFATVKAIGKGTYGRVLLVTHRIDGKVYALKVLNKEEIREKNEEKHVMSELRVLKENIGHPFLVNLYFSFQSLERLYFVLEYVPGGELFSYLQRERRFGEAKTKFYAACMASALGHLHSRNIIYRDLKPENLLLDRQGYLVLTDFGLCKENMKRGMFTTTFCGTPEYLAPEILLQHPYDRSVDWWSFGAVVYEMLNGLPPFYSEEHDVMFSMIVSRSVSFKVQSSMEYRDLISSLLMKERIERLGFDRDFHEIEKHPFFFTVNWNDLLLRKLAAPMIPSLHGDDDSSKYETESLNEEQFAMEQSDQLDSPSSTENSDFAGFSYIEPSFLLQTNRLLSRA